MLRNKVTSTTLRLNCYSLSEILGTLKLNQTDWRTTPKLVCVCVCVYINTQYIYIYSMCVCVCIYAYIEKCMYICIHILHILHVDISLLWLVYTGFVFSTIIVQPLRFHLKLHWLCYKFWVAISGWTTLCNLSSAVAKPHSVVAVVQRGIIMGLMLWRHVVICVCAGVQSPKETQRDAFSFLSSFFKFQFSLQFLYT